MHSLLPQGGAILALQEPPAHGPVSTSNSRSGPLQLLAAPAPASAPASASAPAPRRAQGQLYWDHGDTLSK